MEFNKIDISEDDLEKLTVAQMKMLRAAQQKKNELYHKMDIEYNIYLRQVFAAGMKQSNLLADKWREQYEEFDFQCAIIADNLIYNMTHSKPSSGGNTGGGGDVGDDSAGYIVDYSLSYGERYIIVRDYYLAIPDPVERMALYGADDVARKYLGTYYKTLYNVLSSYSK